MRYFLLQASQRYSSSTGLTPKLSLKTREGALLCENDFISDVLMNNEEVIAVINQWDTGSICEKYERECAILGIGKCRFLISIIYRLCFNHNALHVPSRGWPFLLPFPWAMNLTKANKEMTLARHAMLVETDRLLRRCTIFL